MSVFAWALTYIGAATVSYLFMWLLDKLDRPGKLNNGRESAMQYREPERPLEPKDYKVPRCPVCGEETDTLYKNIYEEIVGCDGCIRTVDAWEEKE